MNNQLSSQLPGDGSSTKPARRSVGAAYQDLKAWLVGRTRSGMEASKPGSPAAPGSDPSVANVIAAAGAFSGAFAGPETPASAPKSNQSHTPRHRDLFATQLSVEARLDGIRKWLEENNFKAAEEPGARALVAETFSQNGQGPAKIDGFWRYGQAAAGNAQVFLVHWQEPATDLGQSQLIVFAAPIGQTVADAFRTSPKGITSAAALAADGSYGELSSLIRDYGARAPVNGSAQRPAMSEKLLRTSQDVR